MWETQAVQKITKLVLGIISSLVFKKKFFPSEMSVELADA